MCFKLSRGYPVTRSWSIMLLSENGPALWSVTICRSAVPGLGTTWTGIQYIPGKRSVPKVSEKHPFWISVLSWQRIKSAFSASIGVGQEPSYVSGYPSLRVFAHGQKPSRNPVQTDATKEGFGWSDRSSSKRSTLIGVIILNRDGFLIIVW